MVSYSYPPPLLFIWGSHWSWRQASAAEPPQTDLSIQWVINTWKLEVSGPTWWSTDHVTRPTKTRLQPTLFFSVWLVCESLSQLWLARPVLRQFNPIGGPMDLCACIWLVERRLPWIADVSPFSWATFSLTSKHKQPAYKYTPTPCGIY